MIVSKAASALGTGIAVCRGSDTVNMDPERVWFGQTKIPNRGLVPLCHCRENAVAGPTEEDGK